MAENDRHLFENSQLLVDTMGRWPSFHDAAVKTFTRTGDVCEHAGWHKSFAIEAPLHHYTVGVASIFLLLVVLVGMGNVAHAGSRQAAS